MEDLFKWILGGIVATVSGFAAWLALQMHQIDTRVAVIEARPTVDPIEYTRAVTQMAYAVTELTKAVADLRLELKEFRQDFELVVKQLDQVSGAAA